MTDFGRRKVLRPAFEKRKANRSPANTEATVLTTASRLPVTMTDISATGAGLTGCAPPRRGRDVQLRISGYTLFGQVAWRRDDDFGVTFEEALAEHDWVAIDAAIKQAGKSQKATNCEVTLLELAKRSTGKDQV